MHPQVTDGAQDVYGCFIKSACLCTLVFCQVAVGIRLNLRRSAFSCSHIDGKTATTIKLHQAPSNSSLESFGVLQLISAQEHWKNDLFKGLHMQYILHSALHTLEFCNRRSRRSSP